MFVSLGEDLDNDGFVGQGDNCPEEFNADQMDIDEDSKFHSQESSLCSLVQV